MELRAGQIAARFTLTQQAVSQHIGVLKSAGLLTERRDGTRRLYSLRQEPLNSVRELLAELWAEALTRLKRAVEEANPRDPGGKRMNAEVHNGIIIATEHIQAAPEVVFRCFTDPTLLTTAIGDLAELDLHRT